MNTLTIAEIETILAKEGLSPMNMEQRDSREGQTNRVGEDGEYDIADFMEGDDSPEARAIIEQFAQWGTDYLKDEFGIEEVEDKPEEDTPRKPWGWLKRR